MNAIKKLLTILWKLKIGVYNLWCIIVVIIVLLAISMLDNICDN